MKSSTHTARSISDALAIICLSNTLRSSTPLPRAERQPVGYSFIAAKAAAKPTKCSAPAVIDTAQCVKTIRLGSGFKASFNGRCPDTTS